MDINLKEPVNPSHKYVSSKVPTLSNSLSEESVDARPMSTTSAESASSSIDFSHDDCTKVSFAVKFGAILCNATSDDEVSELSKQCDRLKTKFAKQKYSRQPTQQHLTAIIPWISWYQSWKCKRRDVKIAHLFDSLVPKLEHTEGSLKTWLSMTVDLKNNLIAVAIDSLNDMDRAVEASQYQVDVYEEIMNDSLQIGLDLKKEMIALRTAIEFNLVSVKLSLLEYDR